MRPSSSNAAWSDPCSRSAPSTAAQSAISSDRSIEYDEPQLTHPGAEDAEFTTAKAGIDYLQDVRW
jgi:hypothetical protein